MKLILASESPYRKELLERLNLKFSCLPADIDEELIWKKDLSPTEVAIELSRQKAKKVFDQNKDSIVIGSDQIIAFNKTILGKPKTVERAIEQLALLQSGPHKLVTAVCIMSMDKTVTFKNETILKIREDLSEKDISAYVNYDQPLNCAGSYKIEGMGIALFEKVETSDFTSIIGLPLMQTAKHLKDFGIEIFK